MQAASTDRGELAGQDAHRAPRGDDLDAAAHAAESGSFVPIPTIPAQRIALVSDESNLDIAVLVTATLLFRQLRFPLFGVRKARRYIGKPLQQNNVVLVIPISQENELVPVVPGRAIFHK